MVKCTSTGVGIRVDAGASLVMEDSRFYDTRLHGVSCQGDVKATRCTDEQHGSTGLSVVGEHASGELVVCVIRKNQGHGVVANGNYSLAKLMLRGGTVSENKSSGVLATRGGKVTVAKAEEGKPQTVSRENGCHSWSTEGGEIIGIPQEKIDI